MVIALSACGGGVADGEPAESYKNLTDRMKVELGLERFGVWPCQGVKVTDECFRMHSPQRWRGIWTLGPGEYVEAFCPKGTAPCSRMKRPNFRLEWAEGVIAQRPSSPTDSARNYKMDFIGRRTEVPSGGTVADYTIVIDRLVSIEEVREQ